MSLLFTYDVHGYGLGGSRAANAVSENWSYTSPASAAGTSCLQCVQLYKQLPLPPNRPSELSLELTRILIKVLHGTWNRSTCSKASSTFCGGLGARSTLGRVSSTQWLTSAKSLSHFFSLSRCCASSSWMVPSILKTKIRNITSHRAPAGREREGGGGDSGFEIRFHASTNLSASIAV